MLKSTERTLPSWRRPRLRTAFPPAALPTPLSSRACAEGRTPQKKWLGRYPVEQHRMSLPLVAELEQREEVDFGSRKASQHGTHAQRLGSAVRRTDSDTV